MLCISCISTCATWLPKKQIASQQCLLQCFVHLHSVIQHVTAGAHMIYSFYPLKQNNGALLLPHTELLFSVLLYTCLVFNFLCIRMKQTMKIIVFKSATFICKSALCCYVLIHPLLMVSSMLSQAIWLWNCCNTATVDLTGDIILNIHSCSFLPPHPNI